MGFIRGCRNLVLAVFMVSLAQACGPMPEETAVDASRSATFELALSVNDKVQTANIEVSPEARRALGALHQMKAGDQKSAGAAPIQGLVQERIQRELNAGKLPAAEGAKPQISVKAQFEAAPERAGTLSADPCLVPGTIGLWYTYVYTSPTCTYYDVVDYYDGFYNQCDGSYILMTYLGSAIYGPYSCG